MKKVLEEFHNRHQPIETKKELSDHDISHLVNVSASEETEEGDEFLPSPVGMTAKPTVMTVLQTGVMGMVVIPIFVAGSVMAAITSPQLREFHDKFDTFEAKRPNKEPLEGQDAMIYQGNLINMVNVIKKEISQNILPKEDISDEDRNNFEKQLKAIENLNIEGIGYTIAMLNQDLRIEALNQILGKLQTSYENCYNFHHYDASQFKQVDFSDVHNILKSDAEKMAEIEYNRMLGRLQENISNLKSRTENDISKPGNYDEYKRRLTSEDNSAISDINEYFKKIFSQAEQASLINTSELDELKNKLSTIQKNMNKRMEKRDVSPKLTEDLIAQYKEQDANYFKQLSDLAKQLPKPSV